MTTLDQARLLAQLYLERDRLHREHDLTVARCGLEHDRAVFLASLIAALDSETNRVTVEVGT